MRLAFPTLLVIAAVASASAQRASTPRTPWGDPDLKGTYTNTYENGTAFERPDQFSGRKLEDVKGEELKKMKLAEGNYGLRNILSAARAEERQRAR